MKKKFTSRPGFFTLRITIALLVCVAGIWSFATGTVPAFLRPQERVNSSQRTLTFEERVSYQRAIEEVYWRHRIWPKERKDPKPALDAVMSQDQIERKVADYLRKSQVLEDYWQRPITAEQLQVEMDRMARHTKQPEVLQELFEALGNDPFVIAECLARPNLAQRLVTNWYAYDQRIHGELKQRAEADLQAHPSIEEMRQTSGKCSEIEFVKSEGGRDGANRGGKHVLKLDRGEWDETMQKLAAIFGHEHPVAAEVPPAQPTRLPLQKQVLPGTGLDAKGTSITQVDTRVLSSLQEDETRYYVTAVIEKSNDHLKLATVSWPKKPLEAWLAGPGNQVHTALTTPSGNYTLSKILDGTGCADDTWTGTSGPPDGRVGHTAVWTGSEMIVWGGTHANQTFFNTGGRYNPSTDNWIPTSASNAPTARAYHTAVWTGSEMIVWGGYDGTELNTGARYDPITDGWTDTSTASAPSARSFHTAVWAENEMIVWGGYDGTSEVNTGRRYNPNTDSWTPINTTNAPAARYAHTAVWTGSEMIVWGGENNGVGVNTGGKYDPGTNNWTATTTTNAPAPRYDHTMVWSGNEVIIWGGYDVDNQGYLNTGGKYDPNADSWTATTITNAPEGRSDHTALWTGNEMIVWGGSFFDNGYYYLNTGGKYNPVSNSWVATSIIDSPSVRDSHTAIWTGSEMIIWGGSHFGYFNSGGRYKPATDSWLPTGGTPDQRGRHTAVWTGTEVLLWGGNNATGDYFDTGGKYVPSTDTWMTTTTINAPAGRYVHTAVWTGTEMIVWGGYSYDGVEHYWNTGGRYNPSVDTWSATTVTNAPVGRELHTAVWTGTEMVIWGGSYSDPLPHALDTGGIYNPGTDSWTATTTASAPSARASHTAVWTGSEMIVWGGTLDASGGRYNPSIDGWTATGTTNAPSGRWANTAVWTGSEMIVWGGYFFDGFYHYLDTGGRYNPNADSWTTTAITNVPDGRSNHTAVWTGTEMIIWGGEAGDDLGYFFNTGGRYDPITDNWITTNTVSAPDGRFAHTAVWTGNEMIVWGGIRYPNGYSGTGGIYCAQSGPPPTPTPTPTPCTGRCGPTPRPRPTPHVRPSPR